MEKNVTANRDGMEAQPVAIAAAPNGGRRTKADHPALPMTAGEIAGAAAACLEAGAAMLHCHVRDRDGRHTLDAAAYRDALDAVHRAVGDRLVLQITTEAVGRYRPDEQMAAVRAVRPEAASLALCELAPDTAHEAAFARFLAFMRRERIVPQIILYRPEEAVRLKGMMARGLIPFEDVPVLYVLGRYRRNQRSQPADLLPFLAPEAPRFGHFMVCAFGPREMACVATAAALGGHVRVGFENNLHLPDGRLAPDNAASVRAAAGALAALGLKTADADGLRAVWAASMN